MTTYAFSTDAPARVKTGLLILPVFQGEKGTPEPGPGVKEAGLDRAFAGAKLSGKRRESLLVPRRDKDRFAADAVLLIGVGPKGDLTPDEIRRALGRVAGRTRRFGSVATSLPLALGVKQAAEAVRAAAEGLALGSYRFDRYRGGAKGAKAKKEAGGTAKDLKKVVVLGSSRWDKRAMAAAVKEAATVTQAVLWARDLINTPAGDLPPAELARQAQEVARGIPNLTCKVWTETQLERGGFNGILGVGKGSVNPPRMIELTYRGARGSRKPKPIALAGKGICFDSGGLSIKDAKSMETMKYDMGGAASILATVRAAAELKLPIDVIAAIPCAENLPSGSAQKPGDVITHRGGTTSEVLNTDAEGRLVLADVLAYLAERKPAAIIDAATLTGACVVALGEDISGVMANEAGVAAGLVDELRDASDAAGESVWELPLHLPYRRLIDSSLADIKNIGSRWGGAITAAWFLAEFVGDTPWVHLDIAGPGWAEGGGHDLGPKGATGVPVRTLVRFLQARGEAGA
jgi:leucyl aminopeptidase